MADAAPVLLRTIANATLAPGSAWSAQCEASGSPAPVVSWALDGAPLESSPGGERVAVSNRVTADGVLSYLNVSALAPEHGGRYTCTASNAVGSVTHQAYLHILGPPFIKPMQDKTVTAGTDAIFNCYVTGHPISSIHWEKDGRPLNETERRTLFSNGTLSIKDVDKSEDSGVYVCIARNPSGRSARRKVKVQVLEAPEIDPILIKPKLQRGMRIHLTCIVSKGDSPVSIVWLKDGSNISQGQGITEKTIDDFSSTLSFSSLTVKHTGNYTCRATNAVAVANYTVPVVVNVPPSWKVEPSDTEAVLGSSLRVDCAADGSPVPQITWRKQSLVGEHPLQELPKTENYRIFENGSMWIQNVIQENKGYYICEAINGVGNNLSKTIHIVVHVPARISRTFQNVTVKKGETAILDCVVEGDKPIKINWLLGNHSSVLNFHSKVDITEETMDFKIHSKMTLKNALRSDSSCFVCNATNKYGSDHSEFYLIVQEIPDPPAKVHLTDFYSRSVNITWKASYNGNSPIRTYIIQIKNSSGSWQGSSHNMVVDGSQTSAIVTELQPAHSYEIRVLAENSVGVSNASESISVTTSEEAPSGPPRDVKVRAINSEILYVSWKPPEPHLHNGEIIGYYIGYCVRNSTESMHYKTFEVIPGMDLHTKLTNLLKFTEYSITVQAYNRAGTGPHSHSIIVSTDEDVPGGPPTDIQCTSLTSHSILVLWSAPLPNEINGILLGYRIVYRALSTWDDLQTMEEQTSENKIELLDLIPFCNYSIEVKAYTRKGDGAASNPVFCRTQEDVPTEPEDIKALIMDSRTILLSWKPPRYPNGRIRKYKVYVKSLDGVSLERDQYDLPSEQTYYSISHLVAHHRYEFWVTASTIVGEGSSSRHVVQSAVNHVPARIASFGGHVITVWKEELKLPCITVGQPNPHIQWKKNAKRIHEDNHLQVNSEGTLHIASVQITDAGNYSCSAENIFGKEEIQYIVSVQESRIRGVPSAPTNFQASSSTIASVYVEWQPPTAMGSSIKGYYLHFKREFGEWEQISIPAHETSYTVRGLQCGTRHQLYLQAFNQLGKSSPTPIVSLHTQGAAPVAPSNFDLIHVNSTSIALNITSWRDGGCPITSFVVEYRLKHGTDWTLVSNNLKAEQREYFVLDLNPETWYTLRMTAHNSAGSTVSTYDFVTLTHSGGFVAPELIVHSEYGQEGLYSNIGIIITTVASLIIVGVSSLGFFLYMKKKHETYLANKYGGKPSEIGLVADMDNVGGCDSTSTVRGNNVKAAAVMCQSAQEAAFLSTPSRVSFGCREDISPYATFLVPNHINIDGSDKGSPLSSDQCFHYQPSERSSSSIQSVQMKIPTRTRSENEVVDWIPLHSLHQSNRY
ncbi:Down syndrome cell adhesion molecule-like protein Dscam2 [Schistocerca gregaria]|uniref:Down syndrome cell adhesion molecule-like protein Dscam2 n=1 Tax=Schistocerca gregaria TaxID=7010 RepID=UPI00211F2FCC|nr:Down syndrome cell adhesion molecule-like protein Dscam2 [Schistocerca gregaria]XP_049855346.1 Down syndrome cell adhesion molecule-like protein Dscam2 [Schistocerca gregaria]